MHNEKLKETLLNTIGAIQAGKSPSKLVFRAETRLIEDVKCTAKVRDFSPVTIDEPPELGGSNSAMNPVELLLVALGTCQEIMYAAYASVMGIDLEECKVNVKGNLDLKGLFGLDPQVPSGFTKIFYETHLKSSASEEMMKKLVETVESHCPVYDTLTRQIEVEGKVLINGN